MMAVGFLASLPYLAILGEVIFGRLGEWILLYVYSKINHASIYGPRDSLTNNPSACPSSIFCISKAESFLHVIKNLNVVVVRLNRS
jgi:hypothetical protein